MSARRPPVRNDVAREGGGGEPPFVDARIAAWGRRVRLQISAWRFATSRLGTGPFVLL